MHDPIAARAAAEEGHDLANAIGNRFDARRCRWYLGVVQLDRGDLAGAVAQFAAVADEAETAHDEIWRVDSLVGLGIVLAHQVITRRPGPPATRPSRPLRSWAASKRSPPTTCWP